MEKCRKWANKCKVTFKRLSIRRKVAFLFSLIFALVFIICWIGISFINHINNQRELLNTAHNNNMQMKDNLTQYLKDMDFTAYTTMYSNWAQNILKMDYINNAEIYQAQLDSAAHFLNNISQLNNDMGIAIYGNNGIFVMTGREKFDPGFDIRQQGWFSELERERKYMQWGEECSHMMEKDRRNVLTMFYTIRDYHTLDDIGYIVFHIPLSNWNNSKGNNRGQNYLIVENRYGDQIHANFNDWQEEGLSGIWKNLYEFELGEQIYHMDRNHTFGISVQEDEKTGWRFYSLARQQKSNISVLRQGGMWIGLIVFVGSIIMAVAVYFSRYLSNPIIECKNAFLELRNNRFGTVIKNSYEDEIGEMIEGFNEMSLAMKNLFQLNMNMEKLNRESEFEILQQKINPHFLYNTLEIINGLILEQKSKQAVAVCETFGRMFRYNLGESKNIKLCDEYEYVRQYLSIVYYKIEGLTVESSLDKEIEQQPFHKFILQPLIENSVKHGFKNKREECFIQIRIFGEDNKIIMVLMDNGCGITEEVMCKLRDNFELVRMGVNAKFKGHIGINNVYQRLWLLYGEDLFFDIKSRPGAGTRIQIKIPSNEL